MTQLVGMVGLGLLGAALAERIAEKGTKIIGYDIAAQRREAAQHIGIEIAQGVSQVVEHCEWIVLCLPNGDVAGEVLRGMAPHLRPGQTIVDTTTASPEQMIEHAEFLSGRGVAFVEAEIAGSSAQARRGEVTVFAAGEEAHVSTVLDLLATFAVEVCYVGPTGNAAKLKLVHNLILGLHRAVLAEGLSLAAGLGLDPSRTLEILQRTPAASAVMPIKGPKMVAREFAPQATISQHLKDVRLMLAAAEKRGLELPLSAVHRELLEKVERAGMGQLDNSAIITAWKTQVSGDRNQESETAN